MKAIREAENRTSGEIRVYLEGKAKGDALGRAERTFEKLGMTRTEKRNGILIYFALADQSFAVVGDRGIHDYVGDRFWEGIVAVMQELFSRQDFAGGLEAGIRRIGKELERYFPRQGDDANELPDTVQGG